MSGYYNNGPPPPQGGYGQLPPQPHGYGQPPPHPQQGYGQPPPHPQQGYGQPGYGPPLGQQFQGGYGGPPPGPPSGQHFGGHPQQGYPHQQQQAHPGALPPGHPGQYGAPPGPPSGQYQPPVAYQQAPTGPPAPPSPGYIPGQMSNMNMSDAAERLRKAMRGFGTNEDQLIQILAPLGSLEIASVKDAFTRNQKRDLMKDIHSETSSYFRDGLEAIIRGPLEQDCYTLRQATKGMGTKEDCLNEVLLGRSNADINAIKSHYQHMYKQSLESDLRDDLSGKTERLFEMVLAARRTEESAPINPQQIESSVDELYSLTEGQMGTGEVKVCAIISSQSTAQLRAIAQAYQLRYARTLEECIRKEFSGHMQDALVYMVCKAIDPAKHDADLLEAAMAGAGTKDSALVRRIVMVHWNRDRLQQCKGAYRHYYKTELANKIERETSGDYKQLMVACVSP